MLSWKKSIAVPNVYDVTHCDVIQYDVTICLTLNLTYTVKPVLLELA